MFGCVSMSQRRLTLISMLCFLLFLCVCFVMLRAAAPDTIGIGGETYPLAAGDSSDAEEFLKAAGYVPRDLILEEKVTVPLNWNSFYTSYNELQISQGLDLTPYKGRGAMRLIYALDGCDDTAEILICDNKIAAAHLAAAWPDNGMKRLIK